MMRIILATAALLALAPPAFAQYRGDYYRDYYEDRRGGSYGRRGYDPYDDDDDRGRRSRRSEERYERRSGGGGRGDVCVTAGGTCPHPPVPVGTGCNCTTARGTFNGSVR